MSKNVILLLACCALSLASLLGWAVTRAARLPTGVVPVVWDKEACAHCRMHVGEPAFAAQAQLADGQVLNFDDPGCILQWLTTNTRPVHAVYLHHHTADRWLLREAVGFAETAGSPMGYNLAAVDRDASGALDWNSAIAAIRKKRARSDEDGGSR